MPHTLMKQLTEMKLTGMATALSSQMEQPGTYEELSFRERLALLVTRESQEREQRKQKRLLQKARLRLEASVHDIDYQQVSTWLLRPISVIRTSLCYYRVSCVPRARRLL